MATLKLLDWARPYTSARKLYVGHAAKIRCLSGESASKKSVVFLGTPKVAANVFEALWEAGRESHSPFELSSLNLHPLEAGGRKLLPSDVEQKALEQGFPANRIFSPRKAGEEAFLEELKQLNPDLCVTAAYGNILPTKFLKIPRHGTVNVHPSLLPLYRGAAPVQRALQEGVKVSGVSVAYTVRELDAGPVIAAEKYDVELNVKAPELLTTLFQIGSNLLLEQIPSILDGSAKAVEQDPSKATFAPKVTVEEGRLDFDERPEILHNKVRAFADWPGTRGEFALCSPNGEVNKIDLKIITTRVSYLPTSSIKKSGPLSLVGDALVIPYDERGTDTSCLEITELQPPGKKVMSARDFFNGLRGQSLFTPQRLVLSP